MKKIILFLSLILFPVSTLFSAVTSLQVIKVGSTGGYIEAQTTDNPVLHIRITATASDTLTYLGVYNSLNSWYAGNAIEPDTIANDGVKLWYSTVDTNDFSASSPVYVTHLPTDGGDWWYNTFSQPVADGSHLWVTVDINSSPLFGTIEMQTESLTFAGSGVSSSDEPASPFVLIVTSVTPAENLEILHSPGTMQPTVSTGQSSVIPVELQFINNSPGSAADISVTNLSFKLQSFPAPGALLSPSSVIGSIKLQDKNSGAIYGEINQASIPSAAAPFDLQLSALNIPAGSTITAGVIITMADPSLPDMDFVMTLDSSASVSGCDDYTKKAVPVSASLFDPTDFPMHSNSAKIQKKLAAVNASLSKILPDPQNINKGATNVELMKILVENPGDTNTASAEMYNLKLYLQDGSGAPLIPHDLFSKISITDESGSIKYRVKTAETLETSGNEINFPFTTALGISGADSVTIAVKADIAASTIINNFKLAVNSASDMTCRDRNSFLIAPVSTAALPFYSSLALLSSSFLVSHTPRMPSNIYKGQAGIHALDLLLGSPLSFGSGNILVRGLTLTARDAAGSPVDMSSVLSGIRLEAAGQSVVNTAMPASPDVYIAFPYHVTVPAGSSETVSVYADLLSGAPDGSLQLLLSTGASVSAYQDNDPLRQIFIASDTGDSFPMSSGTGYIGGSSSGISFSGYPNPFMKGSSCRIAYYLDSGSKTTIKVFDLMGNLVKTIIENTDKTAGSHSEDSWDGSDKNNRCALSGTYILKIETTGGGKTKTASTRVIFAK